MTHKSFFLVVLFLTLSALVSKAEKEGKPNIIWFITEDMSPDLGCYGNTDIQTPHIDHLAKDGVIFKKAFATASVCSASRSAFTTGVYQTTIGADFHRSYKKNMHPLPENMTTVFDLFDREGYFVDYNGKKDLNYKYKSKAMKHRDLKERKGDQPVFMVQQTYHTHRPFHADHNNPIDETTVSIPSYYPDHPITRRDWANYLEDGQLADKWLGVQMESLRKNKLLNNTLIVFFGDHGRPHVRDKQFLYDGGTQVPLIISYYKDGKPSKKGLNAITKKSETQKLTSLIDLAPSMLSFANLPVPNYMHGKDLFSKQKSEYLYAARDRSGDAIDKMRAIRGSRYLLIENEMPEVPYMQYSGYKFLSYPVYTLMKDLHEKGELTSAQAQFMSETKPKYELYDTKNDPENIYNIAEINPKLVRELAAKLNKWKEDTNDIFDDPDKNDWDEKNKGKRDWAKSTLKKRGLSFESTNEEILKYWQEVLFEGKPLEK